MSMPYEGQLVKMGFSEKEAKVYLAALELGASPIQRISQKAGVKRATTYVMVESLMDRGLMSTFQKGKKIFFSAETPKRISSILESEKNALNTKQGILKDLLPDLLSLVSTDEKPKISFYEGVEGLRAIHEDVLSTNDKTLENIVSLDDAKKIESPIEDVSSFREKLEEKGVKIRILYSSKEGTISLPEKLKKKWETKKIPKDILPLHGEMTLYGDKVAAFSYRGKIFGTIIESKEITQTFRVLFELAWSSQKIK